MFFRANCHGRNPLRTWSFRADLFINTDHYGPPLAHLARNSLRRSTSTAPADQHPRSCAAPARSRARLATSSICPHSSLALFPAGLTVLTKHWVGRQSTGGLTSRYSRAAHVRKPSWSAHQSLCRHRWIFTAFPGFLTVDCIPVDAHHPFYWPFLFWWDYPPANPGQRPHPGGPSGRSPAGLFLFHYPQRRHRPYQHPDHHRCGMR